MLGMSQPMPGMDMGMGQGAQMPNPMMSPEEMPPADGAYDGAEFGDGGLNPTGGEIAPGQPNPMEGDFQ
jgi:hypothetical protein